MKKHMALVLSVIIVSGMSACDDENTQETVTSITESEQTVSEMSVAGDNTLAEYTSQSDGSARVTVEGTKFMVGGKELWINGVNTPWDNWNDFGGEFESEFWDTHFAELKEAGVNSTRIWVNCNSMVGIKLMTTGEVKEVTKEHWEDLDVLFTLAEKHQIYLMPTLLSFDHFKEPNIGYDRWRMLVQDETLTKSFIDSYVIPFVKRYDKNDYLWSIDLMNEPDWVIENAESGKIGWEYMGPFFASCAAAIHENSDILVTVGLGMVKYNSDKFEGNYLADDYFNSLAGENAYVDFNSTHYYYWQNRYMGFPFEVTPEEFGLTDGKPNVLGEVSANGGESGRTIKSMYENAYNNGWNGVMAWTSNGVDSNGDLDDVRTATVPILELAPEKVFPLVPINN